MRHTNFDWDPEKNIDNLDRHGVPFEIAQYAFNDPKRTISFDHKHSTKKEKRFFCYGKVDKQVITVRFTIRNSKIRIFGAGYWREGRKKYYEKK